MISLAGGMLGERVEYKKSQRRGAAGWSRDLGSGSCVFTV